MVYPPDLSFGPDTRIVLVGTTHCPWDEEFLPPVPHAKNNIDELYRLFTAADICGLDEGCIVRVLDWENASEITEQIARAAKKATDTLVVYYAGHGLYGDAENPLYLAAKKTTEERKAFNGVPVSLVRKAIHSSSARKRILILDCCYSGRAMDGLLAPTGAKAAVEPAIDIEGTYGIAAVPANAKALAPPGEKFTRFTGALLEVLEKGLATGQQVLTLEDVFTEVERKIGRMGDAPPPKRINWDNGQKFRIARNRSPYYREPDQGPNTASLSRIGEAVQNILKPGVWAETPNPSQRPRGPAEESSLQRSPPEPSRNSAVIYDPGHASPPESGGFLNFFSFLGFVGVGLCIMPVLFVVCYRLVQFLRGTVVRDQTVLRPLVPGSFEWEKIGAMELLRHPRDVIRTRKRTAPRKRVISDLVMSGFALLFAALSVILFFALAPKFKVTNLSVRFGYPTGSCPRSQNVYGDVQTNGFGDIS
jgi:Caspase domain